MEEGKPREERGVLLEVLETELPRLLPDLEIFDRGLDLSRGPLRGFASRRADLVARERSGRALLVLFVDGRGDETVLAAINALAFARGSAEALPRPARGAAQGPMQPRIALAAESFSARALEGLALLPERELLLFESRRIESSAGSRLRFVPVALPAPRPVQAASDREGFLATVPAALRGTAELLMRRLARVDAALQVTFEAGRAAFRCEGRDLCALDTRQGGLHGVISALDRSLPIRGMDDADAFLDEVLREHLLLLGDGEEGGQAGGQAAGWGSPTSSPRVAIEAAAPLLTPEEIAAFRD